jgi:SAM-dependent methyltransferase
MKGAEGAVVRFVAGKSRDAWRGIHQARYRFALPYVGSRRVLDVACGSGYGLPILESRAGAVVGVDIDGATLREARASLLPRTTSLVAASGCRLPFADGSFDVVTSFETLEHLESRRSFLEELRRVLRPGGLLILSTPNANVTEPVDGRPKNPHHFHEYRPSELEGELRAVFAEVAMLGQRLDPRFKLSPFRDDQEKLPRTPGVQAQLLLWRILYKLPAAPQDALSRLLWGHPLVAGEDDYQFRPDAVERAPVLLALCRGFRG